MKLLAFCACERVIIDQQGNPSLIMLIEIIRANVIAGTSMPNDVLIPKEWSVFTLWIPDNEDVGKTFEQKLEFETPDGKTPMKGSLEFTIKSTSQARNIQTFIGFPIGQEGLCNLRMWVELNGQAITPIQTYIVTVQHEITAQPEQAGKVK